MKRYLLLTILLSITLIVFIYSLIYYLNNSSHEKIKPHRVKITKNMDVKIVKIIHVDIEGAVFKKGIYEIPENSMMQDALIQAGGISSDADRAYVEQQINLKTILTDGARIYIPRKGEGILENGAQTSVSNN